jgi:alanyl-tRNA synthetase
LFGEKYGDIVRVVIMDPNYSIELCGGTHVGATGELGYFKIQHESAVAAGVRRIEAVCGEAAATLISQELEQLHQLKELFRNPKELLKAAEQVLQENAELRKKIESFEAKQLQLTYKELLGKATTINGISFVGEVVEAGSADALKKLCFELKKDLTNYLVVLAANVEGKAQVAVLIDETLFASKGLEAPKIIKEQIAPLIKGGGGGQKTLATAGGQDASNLPAVIEKVKGLIG